MQASSVSDSLFSWLVIVTVCSTSVTCPLFKRKKGGKNRKKKYFCSYLKWNKICLLLFLNEKTHWVCLQSVFAGLWREKIVICMNSLGPKMLTAQFVFGIRINLRFNSYSTTYLRTGTSTLESWGLYVKFDK